MRRGIGALSKVLVVTVVAGILPLAAAGTAYAGRVRTIVITDASVVEGDVVSAAMSFKISWSGAKGPSVTTVAYATADASATAGADSPRRPPDRSPSPYSSPTSLRPS